MTDTACEGKSDEAAKNKRLGMTANWSAACSNSLAFAKNTPVGKRSFTMTGKNISI